MSGRYGIVPVGQRCCCEGCWRLAVLFVELEDGAVQLACPGHLEDISAAAA